MHKVIALSLSLFFIFILSGWSLLLSEVNTLLSCIILGSFVYMSISLLFNPRWNVFKAPFSPVVILKPFVFVSIFVNLAMNKEFIQKYNESLIIALLGWLSLAGTDMVGMLFKNYSTNARRVRDTNNDTKITILLLAGIFVVGWLWRIHALSRGLLYGTHLGTQLELTSYSNLLGSLNFISTIAFWGLFVYAKRARLLVLLVIPEILWFAASGSKASIATVALSVMFVQFWKGRFRVTNQTITIGLVLGLVFVFSFSVIHLYRKEAQQLIISSGYESFSPLAVAKNLRLEDIEFFPSIEAVGERLNVAWRFSLLYEAANDELHDSWYGKSLLGMFTWWIPRAFWLDKPSLSLGHWFAQEYLGWDYGSRAEAGITIWGEGYLNFGITGAIILPLLWVAFVQWVYLLAVRKGRWGLIFYASAYPTILNSLSANVASPFATMCQMALIVLSLSVAERFLKETSFLLRRKTRRNGILGFHSA